MIVPATEVVSSKVALTASALTEVSNCFLLLLGHVPPEREALAPWGTEDASALLRDLLAAEKFRTTVLTPVLLRESLPHQEIGEAPPWPLVEWAQQRLPLTPQTRRVLGLARNWPLLLELLLADAEFIALAPALVAAGVDAILRDRLKAERTLSIERSIVGAIDAASAFEVRGWALDLCDKAEPITVEFYADNIFLGAVKCGEPRPDVRDHVGGDGNCGFCFAVPSAQRASFGAGRPLRAVEMVSKQPIGSSVVVHAEIAHGWDTLEATRREIAALRQSLERIEAGLPNLTRLASVPIEAYDEYWRRFYRVTADTLAEQRRLAAEFAAKPLISLVMPCWNSDGVLLEKAIRSVLAQSYEHWELIVADDASTRGEELSRLQNRFAELDARIRIVRGEAQLGIAGNTNRGLGACTGDYVGFLDHDDELSPDALFHIASVLQERSYALIYSDEDRLEEDESGQPVHHSPFFKPGFDRDLLLSMNYICHLSVIRRAVLVELGGLRDGFDGAQDHDLTLRVVGKIAAGDIRHVPRILYHWRVTPGSVSRTPELAESIERNIAAAVSDHLARAGFQAQVESHRDPLGTRRPFATRLHWPLPDPAPLVSVILPTRDRLDLLQPCVESLLESQADYPGPIEILVVDNDSKDQATLAYLASLGRYGNIRILPYEGAFNWSALNNAAAEAARGEVLIFLNNDTAVLTRDWCRELVSHALRPDIGAVGARLLYADGTIQHAGVVIGVDGVAGHEGIGELPGDGGYFGRSHVTREAGAVTGACLATRRALFLELEGFDEIRHRVAFNDVDYCMKLRAAGYRIIYTPFATLYHYESKSRGRDISEAQQARHRSETAAFRRRWTERIERDPLYNAHFERGARPFARLRPPP